MQNRIVQRLIFDSIVMAIIFLPVFTAIFLWNVFFQPNPVVTTPPAPLPKFAEASVEALRQKTTRRSHLIKKPASTSAQPSGGRDPFSE